MTLTISENWIRDRVQLKHENADDVRSLALPGTYHEKVTHLGNSLLSFCRLKHLDLSRNALQSLDGLQHLEMLEKVNLYYNNIATLKELYKLRYNTHLEEVDLRLNPVTKNEPDYRLFMVHMLPNLRKLDDRSIRDSERKAALMHFNTDQATELTEHPPQVRQLTSEKAPIPRADYVKSMARKSSALDDDDCEILDLIARTGDLSLPQPLTGSTASYPQARVHTREEMRKMEQSDKTARIQMNSESPSRVPAYDEEIISPSQVIRTPLQTYYSTVFTGNGSPPTPPTPVFPEILPGVFTPTDSANASFQEILPGVLTPADSPNASFHDTSPQHVHSTYTLNRGIQQPRTQNTLQSAETSVGREKVQVQFAENVETRLIEDHDNNLRYTDEANAYTAYTSRGHFTPHPGLSNGHTQEPQADHTRNVEVPSQSTNQTIPNGSHMSQSGPSIDRFSVHQRTVPEVSKITEESIVNQRRNGEVGQEQFIDKILNLVDRYWNGSKSLHRHAKFLGQAQTVISDFVSEMTSSSRQEANRLHEDVARFAQENVSLRSQLASHRSNANTAAQVQVDQTKLQLSLEQAQQDVSALKQQLQMSMQENQRLQEQLNSTPPSMLLPPPANNTGLSQQVDKEMLSALEKEVESLQMDNVTLKLQLKHFTQLQELATMLQESHKSLVTTNDHLLKELDESKLRHTEEVKQLHWSYGELKRTMELTSNSMSSSIRGRMSGGENTLKLNGVS